MLVVDLKYVVADFVGGEALGLRPLNLDWAGLAVSRHFRTGSSRLVAAAAGSRAATTPEMSKSAVIDDNILP